MSVKPYHSDTITDMFNVINYHMKASFYVKSTHTHTPTPTVRPRKLRKSLSSHIIWTWAPFQRLPHWFCGRKRGVLALPKHPDPFRFQQVDPPLRVNTNSYPIQYQFSPNHGFGVSSGIGSVRLFEAHGPRSVCF